MATDTELSIPLLCTLLVRLPAHASLTSHHLGDGEPHPTELFHFQ